MKRSFFSIFLMIGCFFLTYIFLDAAFRTKTKVYVNYQDKSTVNYQVYLLDNDVYSEEFLGMKRSYVSDLVDYIDISFDYDVLYDTYMNGFYSYNVGVSLVAYEDDINDSLWEKNYSLIDDKVIVIDSNDFFNVKASDSVKIDYQVYREALSSFSSEYNISLSGYLLVEFSLSNNLDFNGFKDNVISTDVLSVFIPLTYDTFKINVYDNVSDFGSYSEFSHLRDVNYVFLIISALNLSIGLAILVVVVRDMSRESKREDRYRRELDRILKKYGDNIINVRKMINKKKYNLIYVDSFSELLDVYDKVRAPISYREVKKNYEAIFVIIADDSAWIYRMLVTDFD